jgi:hypothetical protein
MDLDLKHRFRHTGLGSATWVQVMPCRFTHVIWVQGLGHVIKV